MPLMLLLLAALLCAVVWGFVRSTPPAAPRRAVLAYNGAVAALALALAFAAALPLHADALLRHPDQRFLAVYLAITAGGAALMLVLIAGGLARNLLVFRRR